MDPRLIFNRAFGLDTKIAGAVFLIVLGVFIFSIARGRARPGRAASRTTSHSHLEAAYVVVLLGIASFLVVNASMATAAERTASGPAALTVRVTGYQWCWQFAYPASGVRVTATCTHGNDPTLVLPTNTNILVDVTSNDVIHNFWVPHLDYKIAAYPNYVNSFPLVLHHTGRWVGRCAEFCGLYHDRMDFYLKAVPPATFRAWLAAQHPGTTVQGTA